VPCTFLDLRVCLKVCIVDSKLRKLLDQSKKSNTIQKFNSSMELTYSALLLDEKLVMNILEMFFNFPSIELYVDDLRYVRQISGEKLSTQNKLDFEFIFKLKKLIYEYMTEQEIDRESVKNIIEDPNAVLEKISTMDHSISKYLISHSDQLLLTDIINALILLCFAQVSLKNEDFKSMFLYKESYNEAINKMEQGEKDPDLNVINDAISAINKRKAIKANEVRWQGHVEQQRRKYLEMDQERQSLLGKKLAIKDVAMWIYNNRNESDSEYETIRNHLSKARKGVFTND